MKYRQHRECVYCIKNWWRKRKRQYSRMRSGQRLCNGTSVYGYHGPPEILLNQATEKCYDQHADNFCRCQQSANWVQECSPKQIYDILDRSNGNRRELESNWNRTTDVFNDHWYGELWRMMMARTVISEWPNIQRPKMLLKLSRVLECGMNCESCVDVLGKYRVTLRKTGNTPNVREQSNQYKFGHIANCNWMFLYEPCPLKGNQNLDRLS